MNPFLISNYLTPDYFCDRIEETGRVISAIENHRNLTLISIRRLGKTGLIKNIFYHLKNSKYRLLYIDILSTTSLHEFIQMLGNAIVADEKKNSKDFLKRISRLLSGIKAKLVFDEVTGNPSIEVGYENYQEAEIGIGQIFEYLSNQKVHYVIAIDEFQQITFYKENNVEALLRTYIQQIGNVSFIFSGSNKHILSSMFSEYNRPFYQSSDFLFLQRIPADIYAEFIYKKFLDNKYHIEKTDIRNILNYYDCFTFYVQSFFNHLYAAGEKKITPVLIEKVKSLILEEREYVFYNYRNLLTESQFKLLKAIAKEGSVDKPNSQKFMKKYGFVQPSSLNRALKALLDKEMIYEENDFYKVYDVFFSKWLSKI